MQASQRFQNLEETVQKLCFGMPLPKALFKKDSRPLSPAPNSAHSTYTRLRLGHTRAVVRGVLGSATGHGHAPPRPNRSTRTCKTRSTRTCKTRSTRTCKT
eukprot:4027841-Pleurochrysis_carterae.AAC.2